MQDEPLDGIAIVGLTGRFPGGRDVHALWHDLLDGIEMIAFFSDEELRESGVDPAVFQNPNYVRARGALGDADYFDAAFFGHSPHVAALMDPQHRLFLECAWAALEDAGYDPERYTGRIGVFAGESMNTYLLNNVLPHIQMVASVDSLQASIGNDKDSLTTEVSYKLNLRGPSVTVQTSSSTSLAAVHMACQSLLSYESDMALSGGVSIHFPEKAGYLYHEGGATSADGHCRAFDARSSGFVNGHGAGVVVLKRLEDAVADRDTIYAVIKGSAINNDGAVKVSYMAPSVDGQAEAIAQAQMIADVHPETISYVEAHGTGTNLGDPIEIAALTQAFRSQTDKTQFCAIGSIKTNIGHLDSAAGVAGLIKTALSLRHKVIPPSLHFEQPNPRIDFANSPFYVNAQRREWDNTPTPRRAGVSSFGMGGTNVHVILEEAPPIPEYDATHPWHALLLSAKTSTALDQMTVRLRERLYKYPHINIADVAYTLHIGRQQFNHRRMLVCRDREDALEVLETNDPERILTTSAESVERPVVFMFSGQGAQYVRMAEGLYQNESVFREYLDRCASLLMPHLGLDLREILFPQNDANDSTTERLNQTWLTQPALFAVEYALAQLWMTWGIQPRAMIGHSIGEYVAACLAGVFTLEDALTLVAARGRMMQELPSGAMLAVPLPEEDLQPLLNNGLSLAAVNSPALCVVSGAIEAVDQLDRQLSAKGLDCRRLHTSHAFHSAMMEPVLTPFTELIQSVSLHPPQIPYISNLTGTWITDADATDPHYWAKHLRQAVRFADGLRVLFQEPHLLLLEVGPGQTLATLARQHPDRTGDLVVVSSLRHPRETQPDRAVLLGAMGRLWLAGVPCDATHLYEAEQRTRIPLPTYPFERQRYWLDPQPHAASAPVQPTTLEGKQPLNDWLYTPIWTLSPLPQFTTQLANQQACWIVFTDDCGLGVEIANILEQHQQMVVRVMVDHQFRQIDEMSYAIDPQQREHYDTLFAALRMRDWSPAHIIHAWSVTHTDDGSITETSLRSAQHHGYQSLLYLAQALGKQESKNPIHITVVSTQLHSVAGEIVSRPEKATLLGPCKGIPQEYPHITCQSIDIILPITDHQRTRLAGQIIADSLNDTKGTVVAYRTHQRWEQQFTPTTLDTDDAKPQLRDQGVYLITGGFGELGSTIARYLAQTVSARLVLVGRTELPPRSDWDTWHMSHTNDDSVSQRIALVQELESLGAEVLVARADVAQTDELQWAMAQAYERFGALHGVIHAAGLVGRAFFCAIQDASAADSELHFPAKVQGVLALEQALAGRQLDFCMLCSSMASILGGLGFTMYAAANLFMDAMALTQSQYGTTPWISVNWDALQATTEQHDQETELTIAADEALLVIQRVLSMEHVPQIAVSTGHLATRMTRWIALEDLHKPVPEHTSDQGALHQRPDLPNPYVAPRNEIEHKIADLWRETLGIDKVGVYDNFFDLGGNSLTGIRVIGHVKDIFGIQIPTVSLYEGPSVSALTKLITQSQEQEPTYEQSLSRGERRREKRRSKQHRVGGSEE